MQASTYLYVGGDKHYCTGLNLPHTNPEAVSCQTLTMPSIFDFLERPIPTTEELFSLNYRSYQGFDTEDIYHPF